MLIRPASNRRLGRDVVPPAFAGHSNLRHGDEVFDGRTCSNQLSYGPIMAGPAGLEPATRGLTVHVVRQSFAMTEMVGIVANADGATLHWPGPTSKAPDTCKRASGDAGSNPAAGT